MWTDFFRLLYQTQPLAGSASSSDWKVEPFFPRCSSNMSCVILACVTSVSYLWPNSFWLLFDAFQHKVCKAGSLLAWLMSVLNGLKRSVLMSICQQNSTKVPVLTCDLCPFEAAVSSCCCDFHCPTSTHSHVLMIVCFLSVFFRESAECQWNQFTQTCHMTPQQRMLSTLPGCEVLFYNVLVFDELLAETKRTPWWLWASAALSKTGFITWWKWCDGKVKMRTRINDGWAYTTTSIDW